MSLSGRTLRHTLALVKVFHSRKPNPHLFFGSIYMDDYHCVASAEMVLPTLHPKIDPQRFVTMARRVSQECPEGWARLPCWEGYANFGMQYSRSTRAGDLISVSLYDSDKGVFEPERRFFLTETGPAREPHVFDYRETLKEVA